MSNVKLLVSKVVVPMVAVGSLTFAGAGVAGAATQPAPPAANHTSAAQLCTLYGRHQTFALKNQAKFAAKTAKFGVLADNARKAGHTKLADYWAAVVARRNAHSAEAKADLAARSTTHVHALGRRGRVC
jgi:hypothetical protein